MIVGIGVDLCEVARITRSLAEPGFVARVFTDAERAYCERRRDPARAQSYAARFAAKEAAMKALGSGWGGGVGWHDVELVRDGDAAPELRLHGAAATLAARRGVVRRHVSVSHTADMAIAWVILEADPTAPAPASDGAAG